MSDTQQSTAAPDNKAQLATLKEKRGPVSESLKEYRNQTNKIHKAILAAIESEAKNAPDIAHEINMPSVEVFWHINALRKYGKIEDAGKKGDYQTYKKKEK